MSTPLRDQLRRALVSSGLTQAELAERLGYHGQAMISRTLSGEREIKIERIEQWVAACGYSLQIVPLEPAADDLEAAAAGLPERHRAVLARLAGVVERLPDGALASLEMLVDGWVRTYGAITSRESRHS